MKRKIVNCFITGVTLLVLLMSCDQTKEEKKGNRPANLTEKDKLYKEAADNVSAADSSKGVDNMLPGSLTGRWLRSDGDYIIEIFSLNADGTANVGYFNPKPINVEKGDWVYSNGRLLINVVLRDANYPGSKYSLGYNPENDTFTGSYYQAVEGVYYDVVFSRKK
ncbi:MAG: hypothetical protein WAW07_09430 [Bacteroidales bacterium]